MVDILKIEKIKMVYVSITLPKKYEKILIVDDEKDIRFILEEILTENKYSVVTVGTVKEAEDFIRENSFDLALLDVLLDETRWPLP